MSKRQRTHEAYRGRAHPNKCYRRPINGCPACNADFITRVVRVVDEQQYFYDAVCVCGQALREFVGSAPADASARAARDVERQTLADRVNGLRYADVGLWVKARAALSLARTPLALTLVDER